MRIGSVSEIVISIAICVTVGFLLVRSVAADVLSDPMRPYTRQVEIERSVGGKGFVLSAILYSADRRVAIVNGQPVSEGQRVNGARVRRIDRGKVELEVDGEILKLALITDKRTK